MGKKQIIFVDDDPSVLESIQRILFDMDDEWDMEFAGSGKEALAYMEKQSFDVIVSDMRMPEMDGAVLLSKVMELYPATVRFILSGFSDKEMILRTVGPADQFLTKPCDPEVVKSAIINALESQKLVSEKKFRAIALQMSSLPTLPDLYIKLQETIKSAKSSFEDISNIVQNDVAITAKVLQLANSAFFGLKNRIDDLQTALTYLGLESLKAVILSSSVFSQFNKEEINTFNIDSLYKHSVFVSLSSRKIMEVMNNDQKLQDIACMAGMLHDVGKLIFIRNKPDEYKEIYRRLKEENTPLFMIEKEVFGITHADIGGYLMTTWGLPEEIVKIISQHHNPADALGAEFDPLAVVFIANSLAHEEIYDESYNIEKDLEKDSISKVEIRHYLPEWRKIIRTIKEIQEKESENNAG